VKVMVSLHGVRNETRGDDTHLETPIFRRPGPEYEGILPTTWDDLEESGWVVTESTTMGVTRPRASDSGIEMDSVTKIPVPGSV